MQRFILVVLIGVLAIGGVATAAAESPFAPIPVAQGTSVPAKPEIITDPKTGTISIRLDGKDIVVIDKDGLHVASPF